MAVAPTMMRAATAAAPSMVVRTSDLGPVSAMDPAVPGSSVQSRGGTVVGGQQFGFGAFSYDTMSAGGRRPAMDGWFVPPEPPRQGRMDSGLFTASSEMFGILFTPHPQYPVTPGLPGGPTTKAAIQHSVTTYEQTSAVIHNELAPRGEQLTVTI